MKKILYIASLAAVGLGVFGFITGESFTSILLLGGGALLGIGTFVAGKLIDASVEAGFDGGNGMSLEMKINSAISEARQNKFKAESEIRRLTAWSNDAIYSAYSQVFDAKGVMMEREKLLANYSKIKEEYIGQVSFETEDKCDKIIRDYQQKIDGYKQRIEVFEQKQKEYTDLKEKMKAVKQNEKRLQQLDKHHQKIEAADKTEMASIAAGEYDLSNLTMSDLEQEVAQREEYFKQLEQLDYKYKD